MGTGDEDARRRLTRMPRQGAIVAVLAIAGLASSFMFTLVVPIQSKLPELLDASRDDTARIWNASSGAPTRTLRESGDVLAATYLPGGEGIATAGAAGVTLYLPQGRRRPSQIPAVFSSPPPPTSTSRTRSMPASTTWGRRP